MLKKTSQLKCYIKNNYYMQMSPNTALNKSHTKLLKADEYTQEMREDGGLCDFNVKHSCGNTLFDFCFYLNTFCHCRKMF